MTSVAAPVLQTTTCTVLEAGLQTTVQDLPGRVGLWSVGVPPSGAWDNLSFALANAAVGNAPRAAGLEAVVAGPTLVFSRRTLVCLAGAALEATLDGRPLRPGLVAVVPAGGVLAVGRCAGPGMRAYVAVAGGIDVPEVMGSRGTFLLGGFGGLAGRALLAGDTLTVGRIDNQGTPRDVDALLPALTGSWTLRVVAGPHGAPEHLTAAGVGELFAATWTVDHRADRTGVRLLGPRPQWSRVDGGEAGLHPSNIHDSAYAVGAVMLSGDTPVIVGPDGPSLGGFVVPCVVIGADQWKLAQLRPGDTVRLDPVSPAEAERARVRHAALLASSATEQPHLDPVVAPPHPTVAQHPDHLPDRAQQQSRPDRPLALLARTGSDHTPDFTVRLAGEQHVLVEAGPAVLDLTVRMWIHLLGSRLHEAALPGVLEVVEGVRSLLVKVDPSRCSPHALAGVLGDLSAEVPDPRSVTLAVREVTLPIAFDHPAAHEAMTRYQRSVRPDAPWCPDNVEFIRRINDLAAREEVFSVVLAATYLVVGLGDVYLGAPVAVPLDPRHRLVTTKYDPARTWTPQNAVGIGGVYLCVYGMEGPGGYQLMGRTVQVWRHRPDSGEQPWLLRQFDRLRFTPVSADELADLRADVLAGRRDLDTTPARFSLQEVADLEAAHAAEIAELRTRRRRAFDAERRRWTR